MIRDDLEDFNLRELEEMLELYEEVKEHDDPFKLPRSRSTDVLTLCLTTCRSRRCMHQNLQVFVISEATRNL